jgi:hypothetical protein
MRLLRSHPVPLVLVALLMVAALGVYLDTRGEDEAQSRTPARPTPQQQITAIWGKTVQRGEREARSGDVPEWPFSGARVVAGGMPEPLRRGTTETLGGRAAIATLGLRFGDARRAETPSGIALWVVPANSVMCLIRAPRIATSCQTSTEAASKGLFIQTYKLAKPTSRKPTSFSTIGVVPDDTPAVRLIVKRQTITVPVTRNAFDHTAKSPIRVRGLAGER